MVDIGFCVVIGRRLEVEIVQPDGARTRVVGTIDRIPVSAGGNGVVGEKGLVCNFQVTPVTRN